MDGPQSPNEDCNNCDNRTIWPRTHEGSGMLKGKFKLAMGSSSNVIKNGWPEFTYERILWFLGKVNPKTVLRFMSNIYFDMKYKSLMSYTQPDSIIEDMSTVNNHKYSYFIKFKTAFWSLENLVTYGYQWNKAARTNKLHDYAHHLSAEFWTNRINQSEAVLHPCGMWCEWELCCHWLIISL